MRTMGIGVAGSPRASMDQRTPVSSWDQGVKCAVCFEYTRGTVDVPVEWSRSLRLPTSPNVTESLIPVTLASWHVSRLLRFAWSNVCGSGDGARRVRVRQLSCFLLRSASRFVRSSIWAGLVFVSHVYARARCSWRLSVSHACCLLHFAWFVLPP